MIVPDPLPAVRTPLPLPGPSAPVGPSPLRPSAWWQAVSLAAPAVGQQSLVLIVSLTGWVGSWFIGPRGFERIASK